MQGPSVSQTVCSGSWSRPLPKTCAAGAAAGSAARARLAARTDKRRGASSPGHTAPGPSRVQPSRTPPISVKTAVGPPSSRSSSAITWETALIRARWVKAWGKLPRWRPDSASSSSAKRSSHPAASRRRSHSSRARWHSPISESAETSQKEQIRNVPSLPSQAVVGLFDLVAEDEAVLGQFGGDRVDGGANAGVVGRQEAEQRDQQQRGVERVGVEVLAEDPVADPALEDLGVEFVGLALPLVGDLIEPDGAGQAHAAVDRDPDHQLRGDVVLGLSARLPDPLVGMRPGVDRRFHLVADQFPVDCVPLPRSAFSCR